MRLPAAPTLADTGALASAAALAWLAGVGWQLREAVLAPTGGYAVAVAGALVLAALAAALVAAAAKTPSMGSANAGLVIARRDGISPVSPTSPEGPVSDPAPDMRVGICRWLAACAALTAAALLGYGATGWRAAERLADALPAALEGRDLRVTGVVSSLPQRGASGLRFLFEPDAASRTGVAAGLSPRLAIGWYKGFHEDAVLTQPQQTLAAGQRWQFTLRLRQPHGNANPHGFDSELYTFEQGVGGVGYVRDAPVPVLLTQDAGFGIDRWRQRVRDAIEATVPDRRISGVLAALSVGDQSAIERDDWELFRNTGVAHLVSISGLHVTMFAWLAGAAIAWTWRRSARAMLWCPAQTAGAVGGLVAALAYAVFSGWGVPSQRTVWMLACVGLLRLASVRWPWPLALLAAGVVVTAFDPWALLQAGFWLSFMAVGLLMASGGATGERPAAVVADDSPAAETPAPPNGWRARIASALRALGRAAHGGLRTQWIATIGLAPLSLVFFQQLSLVGLLANLVAIPVVTLLITPLALLGTALPPLWLLAALVTRTLVGWLNALAGWPGAVWSVPAAPGWAQAAALLAAALAVLPLPWRVRALALPLALGLALPPLDRPPPGAFELVAVDVGQGTAVIIRTAKHLLVYDSGPAYGRDSDAGQRVLLPLLRARGETRIDQLMLSHRDNDHTGGAASLLRGLPVLAMSSSIEPEHVLRADAAARGVPDARCEAGQHWAWDGVDFTVVAPPAADYALRLKSNALSCVVQVRAGSATALLTGDMEAPQETALVAAMGNALRSSVMLVPHHGSKTSSTPAFIDAVAPRLALVQAGYRSRFGHPVPQVVGRYLERGVPVIASPACGAFTWRSDAPPSALSADPEAGCERRREQRYWHHRVAMPGGP